MEVPATRNWRTAAFLRSERLTFPGCAHDGDAAVLRSGLYAGLRAYERAVYRLSGNSAIIRRL